jgi:hypothetical protein
VNSRNTIRAIFICLALLVCSLSAQAQSGRRQQRTEPAAPVPTPTPEPTPKPKADEKEPDQIFVVGADRNGTYSMYPFSFYDAVVAGCAEVLSRGSSAKVDPTSKAVNRGEAIKRAKQDNKTYVVFLELSAPTMGSSANNSYDQIEVGYTVFAPGTGKVATSGRAYQNANRAGPVVVGPTGTGGGGALYREQILKRAGEQAGERILRALHLDTPRTN